MPFFYKTGINQYLQKFKWNEASFFKVAYFFLFYSYNVWQYFCTSHSYIQNELKLLLSKIWPKNFFEKQMFSGPVKQTNINSFLEESLNIGETPVVVTAVTWYFLIYFTLFQIILPQKLFWARFIVVLLPDLFLY